MEPESKPPHIDSHAVAQPSPQPPPVQGEAPVDESATPVHSRDSVIARELLLAHARITAHLPEYRVDRSNDHLESLALRGLRALEQSRGRGYSKAEYDPTLFHYPLIGEEETSNVLGALLKRGLVEAPVGFGLRCSPTGRALLEDLERANNLMKLQARYTRLRTSPAQHVHETYDRSAFVLVSEFLLADKDGQALANLIVQNGGRLAVLHHRQRPIAGDSPPEFTRAKQLGRPFATTLVQQYSTERVCRLEIGGDPHGSEDPPIAISDFWIRDLVGFFGGAEQGLGGRGQVHYFRLNRDLLAGGTGYFGNHIETADHHLSLKRTRLGVHAVGGFFYPLHHDTLVASAAVFDRHNSESGEVHGLLRGVSLDHQGLSNEFRMMGRPNIVVVPHLFSNPRHIDTAVTQVRDRVFVADISSEENRRILPPDNFENLLTRQAQISSTISAATGAPVIPLPTPFVQDGQDKVPLLTANVLQFYSSSGQLHVVVPWIADNHPDYVARKEYFDRTKKEIESRLLGTSESQGADQVHFMQFRLTNGGLRCATSHIPGIAVDIMRKSHELM